MAHSIVILGRAERDVQAIVAWLYQRSPTATWLAALQAAFERIADNPFSYALAPERPRLAFEIRQIIFKTPRGRRYRAVYTVVDEEVRVLRVRRPGQRPFRGRDCR